MLLEGKLQEFISSFEQLDLNSMTLYATVKIFRSLSVEKTKDKSLINKLKILENQIKNNNLFIEQIKPNPTKLLLLIADVANCGEGFNIGSSETYGNDYKVFKESQIFDIIVSLGSGDHYLNIQGAKCTLTNALKQGIATANLHCSDH
jgi:hypothetical protein